MTEHISKVAKIATTEITFTEEEARTMRHPHNDALVVSLKVANNLVHRILVDNGSSVDVLFKGALDKMNLDGAKLRPVKTPLYGFTGERVDAEGLITLPVTMDEVPHQVIKMIDFLVVDQCSAYNVILGRPTLNGMRAVKSTYHLSVKFPTSSDIGVILGDQSDARTCYVTAVRKERSQVSTIFQIEDNLLNGVTPPTLEGVTPPPLEGITPPPLQGVTPPMTRLPTGPFQTTKSTTDV